MRKVMLIIIFLFGFCQISLGDPTSGIKYLMSETATLEGDRSGKDLVDDPVTLMDFGIMRLKDELSSGRLCPIRMDSIRPTVIIYYERGLDKLKINLSYVQGSFGSTDKELESVKSKIESFIMGLKSLCFAIRLKTGEPINGLQSDLIKYFSHPYKKISKNIGAELDKITEIEVHVSSSMGTTVKCVSALLGKEMSFF